MDNKVTNLSKRKWEKGCCEFNINNNFIDKNQHLNVIYFRQSLVNFYDNMRVNVTIFLVVERKMIIQNVRSNTHIIHVDA